MLNNLRENNERLPSVSTESFWKGYSKAFSNFFILPFHFTKQFIFYKEQHWKQCFGDECTVNIIVYKLNEISRTIIWRVLNRFCAMEGGKLCQGKNLKTVHPLSRTAFMVWCFGCCLVVFTSLVTMLTDRSCLLSETDSNSQQLTCIGRSTLADLTKKI